MSVWVPEARGSTVLHRLSFIARGSLYPAAVYCFAAPVLITDGDGRTLHCGTVQHPNPLAARVDEADAVAEIFVRRESTVMILLMLSGLVAFNKQVFRRVPKRPIG